MNEAREFQLTRCSYYAMPNEEVTLKGVITSTEDTTKTKTLTKKIKVGQPVLSTIIAFNKLANGKVVTITGVITGLVSNGTYSIEDLKRSYSSKTDERSRIC